MKVRPETIGDQLEIRAVHARAFDTPGEARLVDALRAAGRLCVSLVATDRTKIVGHIAFSPVTVLGSTDGVGLAPVSVLPGCQGRGIGEQLVREGLTVCRRSGYGFVVVLGDPHYYRRFGFRAAAYWGLLDEYGGGDAFQAMEFRRDSVPTGGATVHYAPEFAIVSDDETTG